MTEAPIKRPGTADVAAASQPEPHKRMISYFWAKDAVGWDPAGDATLAGFLGDGTASEETAKKLAVISQAGRDDGITLHKLYHQPGGFSLLILWVKPNYPLPRHSHGSDCMYYVASGSIIVGDKTLRAGDGFFVPADCLYVYTGGPDGAEVLEVRYAVDSVTTYVPPVTDKRAQAELELVQANAERWKQMHVGPTFTANRAAG
jgi:hypothetical protein